MTQRIILFNGPPRCGKDTAATFCFQNDDIRRLTYAVFDRISMPIKKAFAGMIGLNIDRFGNVEHWEHAKEDVIPFLGVSYRQWQIDFSEKFMKPLYGEAIFGKLFISRQLRQHPNAVIFVPDCGFDIEYKTFAGHYGPENVLVVKIYREGCSFKNDSRKYLKVGSTFESGLGPNMDVKDMGVNVFHLTNNSTKEDFELKVLRTVKEWLNAAKP